MDLGTHLILFLVTSYLESPDHVLSLGSPLLTAYIPTFLGASLMILQIFANVILNKWWAHGNAYLLVMQAFGIQQYAAMVLAMWNVDAYLYDARLIRYIFLIEAAIFMMVYISGLAVFLD